MANRKYGIYYHGTCADHLPGILSNGLGGYQKERLWNDSYPNFTYFWSPDAILQHGHNSVSTKEEAMRTAFQQAVESATSALARAKDCRIIIIEARIPLRYMTEDISGLGMDTMGAMCTDEFITPDLFLSVKVSQDLSAFKSFFIAHHFACQNCRLTPTKEELMAIRVLGTEYFLLPEHLEDILRWEKVDIKTSRNYKLVAV